MAVEIKVLTREDVGVLEKVATDVLEDPLHAARTKEFLEDTRHLNICQTVLLH
jgi:hypothetical protein